MNRINIGNLHAQLVGECCTCANHWIEHELNEQEVIEMKEAIFTILYFHCQL